MHAYYLRRFIQYDRAIQDTSTTTIDVLVNNAVEQHVQQKLEEVSSEPLERTFRTNLFGMFNLTREVLPHLHAGAAIVNTTSVTAYRGSPHLVDCASTKGAIVAFTRSLAASWQNAASA